MITTSGGLVLVQRGLTDSCDMSQRLRDTQLKRKALGFKTRWVDCWALQMGRRAQTRQTVNCSPYCFLTIDLGPKWWRSRSAVLAWLVRQFEHVEGRGHEAVRTLIRRLACSNTSLLLIFLCNSVDEPSGRAELALAWRSHGSEGICPCKHVLRSRRIDMVWASCRWPGKPPWSSAYLSRIESDLRV